MDRAAFEAWITAPPYEKSVSRQPRDAAWPGQYWDYQVQIAWDAWQAAIKALGWRRAVDEAPKDYERVVAWFDRDSDPQVWTHLDGDRLAFYWLPLPPLPEEEK